MRSITVLLASLASAIAIPHHPGGYGHGQNPHSNDGWSLDRFKTIVTFGDSYTDENRLGYFINHNGSAPPVGWEQGVGYSTSTGGRIWPRYASIYSDTTLYNYAVSGAVCSNQISPRFFDSINAPFPDIQGYELPAFIADSKYTSPNGSKFFTGTPQDTVYAIWIGTNDLGNDAFLTDSQVPGKTLVDFVNCVYQTIDELYANGGRYFVLMNLAPLQLLPQYAIPENGGLPATKYFPDKSEINPNITEWSWKMYEYTVLVNNDYKFQTPFQALINKTWEGANIANFDVYSLMENIWQNPAEYLNGTLPLNVTAAGHSCNPTGEECTTASDLDSYMWYDELHPSEQTDRVVAREFVQVMGGDSKYAMYW